jgi:hypothetical protein
MECGTSTPSTLGTLILSKYEGCACEHESIIYTNHAGEDKVEVIIMGNQVT